VTRPVVALDPAPLPGRAVPVAAACGATPPPASPFPSPSVSSAASPASHVAATGLGSAGASGLVPCAISVRDSNDVPLGVEELWRPRFPGPELVGAAADLLPAVQPTSGQRGEIAEGPRWEIVVSPGVLRVRTRDHAKAERTYERQQRHRRIDADMAVAWLREARTYPSCSRPVGRSRGGRRAPVPG